MVHCMLASSLGPFPSSLIHHLHQQFNMMLLQPYLHCLNGNVFMLLQLRGQTMMINHAHGCKTAPRIKLFWLQRSMVAIKVCWSKRNIGFVANYACIITLMTKIIYFLLIPYVKSSMDIPKSNRIEG